VPVTDQRGFYRPVDEMAMVQESAISGLMNMAQLHLGGFICFQSISMKMARLVP